MKKISVVCICICLAASMTACRPGSLAGQLAPQEHARETEIQPDSPRVYMDEVRGNLTDFTGNQLTLQSEDQTYVFDVSEATLECAEGMITGDEISVIYEGLLNNTDTSTVKALKVVDEYHKKTQLKELTVYGQLQKLTPNTITIQTQDGGAATFPITGTRQYYLNGVQAGIPVYLHYKGTLPAAGAGTALDAGHLKVLSVSDTEPFQTPEPTPVPPRTSSDEEQTGPQQMQAVIQEVNLNSLHTVLSGTDVPLVLDMSAVPCYFPGSAAPGSHVTIHYTGEFNGSTLEGISILDITGEDPASIRESNLSFTVSGTVVASTANTVTISTPDGAVITCNTTNAPNTSTGGMAAGSPLKITFNPEASRNSNIYICLKIEDA